MPVTAFGADCWQSARVAEVDVKIFSEKLQRFGIKAEDYKG